MAIIVSGSINSASIPITLVTVSIEDSSSNYIVYTDANGQYSQSFINEFNGFITPTKKSITFTPTQIEITQSTDSLNNNFTAISGTTYYLDFDSGSDANIGTSSLVPWQNLSKLNSTTLINGDNVLFKRGVLWPTQSFTISAEGSQSRYITFGAYGSGSKPDLSGGGELQRVIDINSSRKYLKFENLNITDVQFSQSGNWTTALIRFGQGCQYIEIDHCKFDNWGVDSTRWGVYDERGGMVFFQDVANLIVTRSEFTGTREGIKFLLNRNNSHVDTHHIYISHNNFHDLDSRIPLNNNTNYSQSGGRGLGMTFQYDHAVPPDEGLQRFNDGFVPGGLFGSEGLARDIFITHNSFKNINNQAINYYRDPDFIYPRSSSYNWQITDNYFEYIEGEIVGLSLLSSRSGSVTESNVSRNIIISSGYRYSDGGLQVAQGFNCIQTHGWEHVIIEDNIIDWCGSGDGSGVVFDIPISWTGITDAPSDAYEWECEYCIVRNNIMKNVIWSTSGWKPPTASAAGVAVYAAKRCDVYNNLMYNCGVGISATSHSFRNDANIIVFNTCHGSYDSGIKGSSQLNVTVKNNITVFGARGLQVGGTNHGSIFDYNLSYSNSIYDALSWTSGANDIHLDPLFYDISSSNFYLQPSDSNFNIINFGLQSGSPAINYATSISLNTSFSLFDSDILHFNRLGTFDLGAYEFQSQSNSFILYTTGSILTLINSKIIRNIPITTVL